MQALGPNSPLIQLLILALYGMYVCCLFVLGGTGVIGCTA